jgi:hypothetical protein
MTPQGSIIIALLAFVLLVFMLNMLRKRRIDEEVSLIWIFAFVAVILLVGVPGLANRLTHLIGAIYPASVLTLLALGFIGVMLVYTSVKISRLTSEVRALAQRQVLVEVERETRERDLAMTANARENLAEAPVGHVLDEGAPESNGES